MRLSPFCPLDAPNLMTFCLGINVEPGLVGFADTRVVAFDWSGGGEFALAAHACDPYIVHSHWEALTGPR